MTRGNYRIKFTRQASKHIQKLTPKLQNKLKDILRNKIAVAPEARRALTGQLQGCYSVYLNSQDRIVYRVEQEECVAILVRAETHCDE